MAWERTGKCRLGGQFALLARKCDLVVNLLKIHRAAEPDILRPLYVQFQSYRKSPYHGRLLACGVARNHHPDLWLDHLEEICPSGLRCEELVHHAARPLITRITHIEGIPEESRGDLVECYSSLAYLKENES